MSYSASGEYTYHESFSNTGSKRSLNSAVQYTPLTDNEAIELFKTFPSKITSSQLKALSRSNIDAINKNFESKFFILDLSSSKHIEYALQLIGDNAIYTTLINAQDSDLHSKTGISNSISTSTINILKLLGPERLNIIKTSDFPNVTKANLDRLRDLINNWL